MVFNPLEKFSQLGLFSLSAKKLGMGIGIDTPLNVNRDFRLTKKGYFNCVVVDHSS